MLIELRDDVELAHVERIAGAARRAAVEATGGVQPVYLGFGRRGLVPKTTSGEIRRGECAAIAQLEHHPDVEHVLRMTQNIAAENGESGEAESSSAPTRSLETLIEVVEEVTRSRLGLEALDRPLVELGLTSAQLMELGAQLEEELGEPIPSDVLLSARNLRDLAV